MSQLPNQGPPVDRSAFTGFRFPPEVIMLAVRWYLRYGLSYRDVEELLVERGIEVDHVTIHRWVQRFTPLLIDAARPCRHSVGARWFVDETYVKVAGKWRYVYRAVDEHGQIIDVFVSPRRNIDAARTFFSERSKLTANQTRSVTDLAQALETVIEEAHPGRVPQHRAVRQQSRRVRSRPTEIEAQTDARTQDRSDSVRRDPRSRLHPEPTPRPLRTRSRRRASTPSGCHRIRRTHRDNLTESGERRFRPQRLSIEQRNSASGTPSRKARPLSHHAH